MQFSTTTCNYFTPQNRLGNFPIDKEDFSYASSTCETVYSRSASTSEQYFNGVSYGDLVIGTFIFSLIIIVFLKFLLDRFLGVKQKDKRDTMPK